MSLVDTFVDTVLADALRGATDAEITAIERQVADRATGADPEEVCTLLNNAAYVWLKQAQADKRVGKWEAILRAHGLNAFFTVNCPPP